MKSSTIMGRKALFLAISAVTLGAGNAAFATTTSFSVDADVIESCTVTATALDFSNYDPIVVNAATPAGDIAVSSELTVTCTNGSEVSIDLDDGNNYLGGRRLTDGTNFLSYELYQEVGHGTVFGGTGGDPLAHSGTGASQTVDVFGNLPGGQNVPVGAYSDSIDVTITL